MSSRHLLRAGLAACLFFAGAAAQATVTWNGTEGVGANIFNGNTQGAPCSGCHPVSGRAYDTYANATALVNSAGYGNVYNDQVGNTRIQADQMPATGVPMTDAEKSLVAAWVAQRSGATAPPLNAVPSITMNAATSVGHFSAVLNASVNDNGADTTYTMEWKRSVDVSYTNSQTYYTVTGGVDSTSSTGSGNWTGGGLSTVAVSHTATGLTCGTLYNFRLRGTNSVGSTTPSAGSFTTDACPSITAIADTSVNEDTTFNTTATSSNASGLTISYSLDATSLASGFTINASTGAIQLLASATSDAPTTNTVHNVTVTASYNSGAASDTEAFALTVTPVNDAPTITSSTSGHTSASEGVAYSYDVSASDVDNASLTYSLTTAPAGMTIGSSNGLISWTPPNQNSNYTANVTVKVEDAGLLSDTQPFTITVSADNDAPTFSLPAVTSAAENVAYYYDVNATDPEGTVLTYQLITNPSGMTINATTGELNWTPPQAGSTYTADVTVRTGDGTHTIDHSFTITVTSSNDPPSFSTSAGTLATEGVAYYYDANASDPEGGTLTYSLTTAPAGMTIDSVTGEVNWLPPQALSNYSEPFTVRVTDGANPVTQPFTITVSADNDAPSFSGSAVTSVVEDGSYTYDADATDPENQALTFALTTAPANMNIVPSTGVITWSPPANSNASANVTVTVSDATTTVSRSFTITITAVNDAPVVNAVSPNTAHNTSASIYSWTALATDVDDSTGLTWSLDAGSAHPSGTSIGSTTGTVSWEAPSAPAVVAPGTYSVVVKITDPQGATGMRTFSFTINDSDGDSADGVADYRDNCPSLSNASQADNESDGQGDVCDIDDDNDSVSDAVESANGYNPLVANDHANIDLDGDGLSNLAEYTTCFNASDDVCEAFGTDSVAPVLTTTDLTLDATGYFTPVPVSATATDAPDGVRQTSIARIDGELVTATSPYSFRPGTHTVEWEAYDNTGNRGSIIQNVVVKPQASLGGSQIVGTATTVPVTVRLNGDTPAPQSDVTLTYTVGGTAVAGTDYTALPGTLTLAGGVRQADISVVVNTPAAGPDKTLVITLTGVSAGDAVLADASLREYTLTITAQPVAPEVTLRASQAGKYRQLIYKDDGVVTLDALVSDANGGSHSLLWAGGGLTLLGSGTSRTFDPSSLTVGNYNVQVVTTDTSGLSTTRTLALSVLPSVPVLADPTADTDGDTIADTTEGVLDANGNGLLDFLDVNTGEAPESIQLSLNSDGLLTMAVADGGLTLKAGGYAIAAQSATTQQAGIQVFETQIGSGVVPNIDENYAAIGMMVDFEVQGTDTTRPLAHVVVPQTAVILPGAQWRQLNAQGQWQNFVTPAGSISSVAFIGSTEVDSISSAPRDETTGQCPLPQSDAYEPGLVAGYVCVQLAVTDGGPNDADGQANGSVQMTGAVTVARDESTAVAPEESQSGGSADIFTLMLLALATLLIRRKEPIR